jgi:decaprenylphospho-beta-D-ribofuranose 2-oxidase
MGKFKTLARVSAALLLLVAGAAAFLLYHPSAPTLPQDELNDASNLNRTDIGGLVSPLTDEEIRAAVQSAKDGGLKIAIAGARHSMGGQSLHPDALVIDMQHYDRILSLDMEKKLVTVQSGATWRDVQEYLNPNGLAVLVMQGPNVFTVGGSLSVNAHGWDLRDGPLAGTVESFHLMTADGTVRQCSRTKNPELFRLTLGGYGLFGIILDATLHATMNNAYKASVAEMDYHDFPDFLLNKILPDSNIDLAEADLSIAPQTLLRNLIAVAYSRSSDVGRTDPLHEETNVIRDRFFFDLSRRFDWGKTLRWRMQRGIEYPKPGEIRTRNNIFRSPIERIRYYSSSDADILQEYFVPPDKFVVFIDELRAIVQRRHVNLLNATVRYIAPNDDTFLNYARREYFAVVLDINVKSSLAGQTAAAEMTREIIDLAISEGGTFYLPYLLYYDKSELAAAYPKIDEFFDMKRQFDPGELFMNGFYAKYGEWALK